MVYKVKGYFYCDVCHFTHHFIEKTDEYYNVCCIRCGNKRFMTKYDIAYATARKYSSVRSPAKAIDVFLKTEKLFNELDNKTSYYNSAGFYHDGVNTIVR